ncbi:MAG: rhodanese-related sulfurtransferase [Oscillatoriales cyanobacterium]|nr:MAG: rhodanese-related sulfurtransferase [Oscillatoriales cyanobacterium]
MPFTVATFYKFTPFPDREAKRQDYQNLCEAHNICGTILLADEGINATIAGTRDAIDHIIATLRQDDRLQALDVKFSQAATQPFGRLKVKLKAEIVTFGQPEANPTEIVGQYVKPADWNELISQPDVVTIDTRNDFEVVIGSFKGAENPHTASFRDLPEFVQQNLDPSQHKRVAMFCTGGIRCEKATSYLKQQGFEEVYHLQGGILKYLEDVPAEESLWEGECFVFDERVSVKQGLEPGDYELCQACGAPVSEADRRSPHYEAWISCPHCYASLTPEKRSRQLARKQQAEGAKVATSYNQHS